MFTLLHEVYSASSDMLAKTMYPEGIQLARVESRCEGTPRMWGHCEGDRQDKGVGTAKLGGHGEEAGQVTGTHWNTDTCETSVSAEPVWVKGVGQQEGALVCGLTDKKQHLRAFCKTIRCPIPR